MNLLRKIRDAYRRCLQRFVRPVRCFFGMHEYQVVAADGYQQYAKCPHCGEHFMRDAHYMSSESWQAIGKSPRLPNGE